MCDKYMQKEKGMGQILSHRTVHQIQTLFIVILTKGFNSPEGLIAVPGVKNIL